MNRLYYGDNLDVLRKHVPDQSVDLIYLDPPFNSNRNYNVLFKKTSDATPTAQISAFTDTWTWSQESERTYHDLTNGGAPIQVADAIEAMRRILGESDTLAYLTMMTPRLLELHRVLKPTGSLYLHCDPTASHYLKIILDTIFGPDAYRNELVWNYGGRGAKAKSKQFPRNHDIILMYRPDKAAGYTAQFQKRTYTTLGAKAMGYRQDAEGRWFKTAPRGDYTDESIARLDAEGRIHWTNKGTPRIKYFLEEEDGKVVNQVMIGDVWCDIPDAMHMGKERLGYETQKPLALLERILAASSKPGDVVLDPFCGCGTTLAAAQKMDREWLGIDITYLAIDLIDKRLKDVYGPTVTDTYEIVGIPRDVEGARALFERNHWDFERWAVTLVHGQPNDKQGGDKGVDGVIRFQLGRDSARSIVSVKGGKSVNPGMVRDLIGTVEAHKADMGILITLTEPTPGMLDEARRSGIYTVPANGQQFPRVQIITVGDLLDGKRPDMPTYMKPHREAVPNPEPEPGDQSAMFA